MMFPNVTYGIFKSELKNRFLCTVSIDGIDALCYVPSSCKINNFVDLMNREVMLVPIKKKDARTKFALLAVKHKSNYVLLNLAQANAIVADELNRKLFGFLGRRDSYKREVIVEDYKCDIFIEDTSTIVEIKTLIAFDKTSIHPTVYSQRAISQLERLKELLRKGYKVCYLLASMCPTVRCIKINSKQEKYYQLLSECIKRGMIVEGVSIYMREGSFIIKRRIAVEL